MIVKCATAHDAPHQTEQYDANNERSSDLKKFIYSEYKAASFPDDTVGSCPNQTAANS